MAFITPATTTASLLPGFSQLRTPLAVSHIFEIVNNFLKISAETFPFVAEID